MVVAMAGGGLVFRLLQVQMSCDRACRVSMRSLMKSHWKVRGFRGVLAAWVGGSTIHLQLLLLMQLQLCLSRENISRFSCFITGTIIPSKTLSDFTKPSRRGVLAHAAPPTDREGGDALLVGAQGVGDGAHGAAVVAVSHATQALLRLRELLQAVEPEVEVLGCHAGPQALVQLTGELVAALRGWKRCGR